MGIGAQSPKIKTQFQKEKLNINEAYDSKIKLMEKNYEIEFSQLNEKIKKLQSQQEINSNFSDNSNNSNLIHTNSSNKDGNSQQSVSGAGHLKTIRGLINSKSNKSGSVEASKSDKGKSISNSSKKK